MIPEKQLDVIKCHLCGKMFNDLDSICTISNDTYYSDKNVITTNYINGRTYVVFKRIHFHSRCFEYVAGDQYIP